MKIKALVGGFAALAAIAFTMSVAGVNDSGYRTVIQSWPAGTMTVKSDPGIYISPFAKTTVYPDFLTYDFSATDGSCSFKNEGGTVDGIKVRYQDGGEGAVSGEPNSGSYVF